MDRTSAGRAAGAGRRLPVFLVLILFLTAGWAAAGRAEAGIQMLNASGNQNMTLSVDPIWKNEGFSAVLYNNRNGLPTSEANAIAMTGEGFLWIGSYAGLIRYDANTFERVDSTTGISNVRCLYVDSRDRLWIGTNDSGVFLMEQGTFRKWGKEEGLRSACIRAITEDDNGVIYAATILGIATIDNSMNLSILQDERIDEKTIRDIRRGNDGLIYGVTDMSDLFLLKDGKVHFFLDRDECRISGVLTMLPDPENPGYVYVGTEESRLCYGELEKNFPVMGRKGIGSLTGVERLEYIDGQIWICAANGIGRLESDGYHSLKNVPMDDSVGHVLTDYEGNLWFTSTRQGVMKIVPNQFTDLSQRYDLPEQVVNSTCINGNMLLIGTDSGLIAVEGGKKANSLPLSSAVTASGKNLGATDLLKYLDGVRIRSILPDSRGRVWISTWRRHGLLCYDRGEITAFTSEDGLFSDQVRTVLELEDGSVAVANRGGLSIIRDGQVAEGYGIRNGITTEILTIAEGDMHELLLGSDGDGIYILSPDGVQRIGTEEGLSSDVILRIRRSSSLDIYWIVTSNSLAYMTPDHRVTTIRKFPYSNNYDVQENSRGDVWVLSSNGIYVVSAEELLAGETPDPVFYGIYSGLPYVPTVNAYSAKTEDGTLYIASSLGVVTVNIEKTFENISDLKITVPYLEADGTRYYPDSEGNFALPGSVRKLTIYPYIFNYSLINPQVSYRLEGFDLTFATMSRNELAPVVYTNLPNATYQFLVQVNDPVGHTDKAISFNIVKGGEDSNGAAGSIIMDITALFFLTGILFYTSMFRKRGRTDDKLFFAMIITDIVMAAMEISSYLLENSSLHSMKELMYAENTIFYAAFGIFPYLYFLYLDFRAYRDRERIRRIKLPYGIPCLLFLALLAVNLGTGWIFSITKGNVFRSGPVDQIVFVPLLFYFLVSLPRVYRIDRRLILLGILLVLTRILWDIWYIGISSTAFLYTLFLIAAHIHVINRPVQNEEAAP